MSANASAETVERLTRMQLITWAALGWDEFKVRHVLGLVGMHEATVARLVSDFKSVRATLVRT